MGSSIIKNRLTNNLLKIYDEHKSIEKIYNENEILIRKEIIDKILYAIDNKLDEIQLVELSNSKSANMIKCSKPYYKESLMLNLQILTERQEYYTCAKIIDYLKKL